MFRSGLTRIQSLAPQSSTMDMREIKPLNFADFKIMRPMTLSHVLTAIDNAGRICRIDLVDKTCLYLDCEPVDVSKKIGLGLCILPANRAAFGYRDALVPAKPLLANYVLTPQRKAKTVDPWLGFCKQPYFPKVLDDQHVAAPDAKNLNAVSIFSFDPDKVTFTCRAQIVRATEINSIVQLELEQQKYWVVIEAQGQYSLHQRNVDGSAKELFESKEADPSLHRAKLVGLKDGCLAAISDKTVSLWRLEQVKAGTLQLVKKDEYIGPHPHNGVVMQLVESYGNKRTFATHFQNQIHYWNVTADFKLKYTPFKLPFYPAHIALFRDEQIFVAYQDQYQLITSHLPGAKLSERKQSICESGGDCPGVMPDLKDADKTVTIGNKDPFLNQFHVITEASSRQNHNIVQPAPQPPPVANGQLFIGLVRK